MVGRRELMDWKDKEWVYEAWCNGYIYSEIAEAYGCSRSTVQKALIGRTKVKPPLVYDVTDDTEVPEHGVILTTKDREWAYKAWCRGYTQEEIAKAYACSPRTIERVLVGRDKVKDPLVYARRKEWRNGMA